MKEANTRAHDQVEHRQHLQTERPKHPRPAQPAYRWKREEANAPAWVWAMRVLGTLGFFVGIYMLTLLTFLF
jgi:hypothetical protein